MKKEKKAIKFFKVVIDQFLNAKQKTRERKKIREAVCQRIK